MKFRLLLPGLIILPILHSGTGSLSTFNKTLPDEIVTGFTTSFHYKKMTAEPFAFWETKKQKEAIVDTAALKKSSWYTEAINTINAKEYEINYNSQLRSYTSPNRSQNLRAFYSRSRFTLTPRDAGKDRWKLDLQVNGIYAGKKKVFMPASQPVISQAGNNIRFNNSGQFITEYINSSEGVRQNFIIKSKPQADQGKLSVQLEAGKDWFINQVAATEIHFARRAQGAISTKHGLEKKLTYNDLKAWDATGKPISASFAVHSNKINIDVNTTAAVYPITIDPISTTADWSTESNQGAALLGWSVASAGDVNGDGYSDVIVGAPNYDNGENDEGKVFVYQGSATGLATTAAWTAESDAVGSKMGYCVNTAGDVNGDGYSDVIVGKFSYSNGQTNEGSACVYYGSATGLQLTPAWAIESNQADAYYGAAVSCAGDVNGDGYSDVIVGAPMYDNGETDEGAAFVYHGSSTGLSLTPNWTGESNQAGASYGATDIGLIGTGNGSAGDVNGDGYSDIIITAVNYDNGQTDEGRAFVYHGSASGLSVTAAWTFESDQASAKLGNAANAAGDVNGDGYGDVVVGVHAYDNGENNEGRAYVFYGSASGLLAAPSWMTEGNLINAQHGCSATCLGDANSDGYADIIIGELQYTNGQANEGAAFAYFGSAAGLPVTPNWTVESNSAGALFGCSVASAGDVNGDGYSDVIVGARGYNNGLSNEGGAFAYYGSAAAINISATATVESNQASPQMGYSVASAGDVNGDGYSDVIVGSYLYDNGQSDEGRAFVYHGSAAGINSIAAATVESNQIDAWFGRSVASAGDVNGDGYSDVIVGVVQYGNGQLFEGAAFVYHGSAAGISSTVAATLESNQALALMGWSVASAGDINGDGYGDVIVGVPNYDNGQNNEGAVFVYHGSAGGINTTASATVESNQANASMGWSVASAGDINGDGYSDVIVGAYRYDNGQTNEGAAFVYHGSASGIITTAAATLESNQANASMGWSVASAGDVNGDGYSDVIVGAYQYDNGQAEEGAAFVFHGSASGINTTAAVTVESNQAVAGMGISVASVGDVNGDSYSDVIVGAYLYDNGQSDEGAVLVYHGSASGINSTVAATVESNQTDARMGWSVASAGDVNGDGYSDVIVGAYLFDNGQTDEGAAFIYHGNSPGTNKRNNLRLYNTNLTTPINSSNYILSNFGAGLFAKSFLGRAKGKLVWETRLNYNAYSGTPITNSTLFTAQQASFTDLGLAGVELKNVIDKIAGASRYTKLRARIKYDPVTSITGQVYSPWRNVSSIIDANNLGALPIDLISFNAAWQQKGKTARLEFKTDKENGICCFDIEKSADGFNYYTIGTLPARNISGIQSYAFMDDHAASKTQFYRLKIKGMAGQVDYSNIQQLGNDKATEIFVFPNPSTDVLLLQLNKAYDKMHVQVVNAAGQMVKQFTAPASNQVISIPVHNLPVGRYWLRLQSADEKQVLQFVKQ